VKLKYGHQVYIKERKTFVENNDFNKIIFVKGNYMVLFLDMINNYFP